MKETRYPRHVITRAMILTGLLLVASGLTDFARGTAHGFQSFFIIQDTSPPTVILDPDSLDFGDYVIGWNNPAKRIIVTNTGGKPLYVDSAAVGGDDSRNFAVVKDTCTGAKVVPYRSCFIDVGFSPSHTDGFEAELKLTDNAPDSQQTIRLIGDGINSNTVPPPGAR